MTYAGEVAELVGRALVLQAQGPDEFPFGYYLHLAEKEAEADNDTATD